MNRKKALIAFVAVAMIFGGVSVASAQTTTTSSLQQTIQSLLQQIKNLQAQMEQLRTERHEVVVELVNTLKEGSSGSAVEILQALLAADPSIYPEGRITGYFGALTRRAVMNFQMQNGLPQVGNVGPQTLARLKEKLKDNPLALEDDDDDDDDDDDSDSNRGKRLCAIVPPGHLIAPGWLRRHDGVVPIVPACQTLPPGILSRVSSTIVVSTSSDVVAPRISRIRDEEATSSVVISWRTNEPATSQVHYGVSTTLGSSTALDTDLATSHSVTVTGLTPDTDYYYKVESQDAAGNLRTSDLRAFDTEDEDY